MKKLAYLSVLALGFGFVSCDDYTEPNPPAQYNPQESILKTEDVTVVTALGAETLYDLAELDASGTQIKVASISCETLPEAYEFVANVEISANDFAKSATVPSTVEADAENPGSYSVYVTPDDLQGVYYDNISKGPASRTIAVRIALSAVIGNEVAYVGGPDNFYGPFDMHVTPFPSELVIEDAYYLVGTICDWAVANAVKFNHSDASPYDDPVFTLAVDISNDQAAGGWWWKVVPASVYATGDWGSGANSQYGVADNGDGSLEGMLVAATADSEPGAGCINTPGQYLLSINMEEGTYAFTSAVPFLYTPGDANGWSQGASQMLYTDNYADYYGFAVLSPGGFKFTNAPDWDHINYGSTGDEGTLSTDGGAGNLSVPVQGLYWCHVNTASLTYEVTLIETLGVIGDATPGGWDNSTALTPSADMLTWTGTVAFGNGEYKIRANNAWDIDFGGSANNLQFKGANIASPGEGTYNVTLNLGLIPYSINLAK